MKKGILTLGVVLALVGVLVAPMAALATNTGTQNASTSAATSISIKAQDYATDVSTITFPTGAPGATVSAPYNNVDGSGSPQAFGGSKKPVVTLVNGAAAGYTIWYNITTFANSVVASEKYVIIAKGGACADATAIDQSVTFGADTVTTGTITTIAATGDGGSADQRDLYLKVTLGAVAGKTGASTITILGES